MRRKNAKRETTKNRSGKLANRRAGIKNSMILADFKITSAENQKNRVLTAAIATNSNCARIATAAKAANRAAANG